MNNTKTYNKNMTASIIFGDYGWNFVFVDTKNKSWYKDETATMAWLNRNGISTAEFCNTCWNEYYNMKDSGLKCGLISYFTKDDEKIYNLAQNLDVNALYSEIFDF